MKKINRIYFFISFFILAAVASVLFTVQVMNTDMPIVDQWSAPVVAGLDNSLLFTVFRWITELGSSTFIVPFSITFSLLLWWVTKDWVAGVMCVFGPLLGYKVDYWIKLFVARERPRLFAEAEGLGYSFPSGHAMVSLITYGLCIYFLMKYTKSSYKAVWINIIGLLLILFIGLSRYVIRVHYLSDVLAGYAFGVVFLVLWIGIYHVLVTLKSTLLPKRA